MLKLIDIKKDYLLKGQEPVHALKGVSINFRENEFVAILGPSGCGKTTLLNITGGLDRYSSGDLVIRGKSTKDFSDRDWDTYRNHSIGFVFQSYNLVGHLTIQGNVELGLTIGGYKKEERKRMAKEALDRVGLQGLYKKKPNQLSGGQMQRVAIARALVTNPEIVMADEPTGALDSETSIQIMDLLKEVAKDRLVIMVTHNPDLAEKYADRIITMKDGLVETDSNPYKGKDYFETHQEAQTAIENKPTKKSKMKLVTSFGLSARNLWSKFKRTALVVVAGSIGIIGVSAVLAVSHGVNSYIESMQDDMLSGNPISVQKSSVDLGKLMSLFSRSSQADAVKHSMEDGKVNVDYLIKYLAEQKDNLENSTINNGINLDYVEFIKEMPTDYYSALKFEYGINPKINVFTEVTLLDENVEDPTVKKERNRYITLKSLEAMYTEIVKNTAFGDYASIISNFTNVFNSAPNNPDYILSQYDVLASRSNDPIAKGEDEVMLVVSNKREITDIFLGQLGYYTEDQFITLINKYAEADDEHNPYKDRDSGPTFYTYDELLDKEFYYVPYKDNPEGFKLFEPNPNNDPEAYYDASSILYKRCLDTPFSSYNYEVDNFSSLPSTARKLKITSILQPKKHVNYGCLEAGFILSPNFEKEILTDAKAAEAVDIFRTQYDWFMNLGESTYPDGTEKTQERIEKENKMKDVYELYTYYDFDIGYSHAVKQPDESETIEYQKISGTNAVFTVIDTAGRMPAVIKQLFGSAYSAETLFENCLRSIGGIDDIPSLMAVYPHSFDEKYLVTDYLDGWNDHEKTIILEHDPLNPSVKKELTPDMREDINYTDNLEVIISLIKNMVNIVTIALLAFTSLSLVVSTVMIGIITYVSVIERIKEIGVIRSLGGRKLDVSNLFNAETFIIGLSSGLFGISVTYILSVIINVIINNFASIGNIVFLTPLTAVIVVLISIGLTLISGLLPARAAARKDPVIALRTE